MLHEHKTLWRKRTVCRNLVRREHVEEFCLEEVTTRVRLRDGWVIGSSQEDEGHKWEEGKVLKSSKGHVTKEGGWHLAPLVERAPRK